MNDDERNVSEEEASIERKEEEDYNVLIEQEDEIESSDDDDDDDDGDNDKKLEASAEDGHDEDVAEQDHDGEDSKKEKDSSKPRKVHKLSLKNTEDFNAKLKRRGVIYIARIPPKLTPTKVKTLLSEFGTVTRVYLQEEDASVRKRRRKQTGNGSKRYIEGWVEFERKSVAKRVALALHQQPISNHKRNPHYGALWNLKYLSQFAWSQLTEKVAYERRVREQKLRIETLQARKETAEFKRLLETGKKLDKIAERRKRRNDDDGTDDDIATKKERRGCDHHYQVQPMDEGAERPSKKALLGALV